MKHFLILILLATPIANSYPQPYGAAKARSADWDKKHKPNLDPLVEQRK